LSLNLTVLTKALFNNPTAIAIDKNFNFYIADEGNFRIRKISLI